MKSAPGEANIQNLKKKILTDSPPFPPFMNILSVPLDHFSYGFGVDPADPRPPRSPRIGPSVAEEFPNRFGIIPFCSKRLLFGGGTCEAKIKIVFQLGQILTKLGHFWQISNTELNSK